MIKAVLFDMDGLMIDSDRIISRSYEAVLREQGKEPVFNARGVVHTPGISAIDNWTKLVAAYDISTDISELAKQKTALHIGYMKQGVDLMPGLLELLQILSDNNIKMAVVSSSIRELVENVLAQHDIGHYFEAIVAGGEAPHGKPAPDMYLAAAAKLGTEPAGCVVLEDAIDGVHAAKAARMKCIAVPAASDLNNPDFSVADMVLTSLTEVSSETIMSL